MQDRFVGDIGDFGKYGLLNCLQPYEIKDEESINIGINWYLVHPKANEKEINMGHGKFIEYLEGNEKNYNKFRICSEKLYTKLQNLIRDDARRVKEVEKRGILSPEVIFFNEPLLYKDDQSEEGIIKYRESWLIRSLDRLYKANLIFLDPDNGIEIESVKKHHKRLPNMFIMMKSRNISIKERA